MTNDKDSNHTSQVKVTDPKILKIEPVTGVWNLIQIKMGGVAHKRVAYGSCSP